ncbi:hypothetical protein [Nocardia stercoris]|nr:hypothetical protein [Nocardia stercoris]
MSHYTKKAEEYAESAAKLLDETTRQAAPPPERWDQIRAVQAQAQIYATLGLRDQLHDLQAK